MWKHIELQNSGELPKQELKHILNKKVSALQTVDIIERKAKDASKEGF